MQNKKVVKNKGRIIIIGLVMIMLLAGLGSWYFVSKQSQPEDAQMFQLSEDEMEDFMKEQEEKGNEVIIRDDIDH